VAMISSIRALCRSGALVACFGLLLLAGCASAELPVYQDDPLVRGSVSRVEHVASCKGNERPQF
jgi:hypothetical protein